MSERCKKEGWQNASLEQNWVEMFKEFQSSEELFIYDNSL